MDQIIYSVYRAVNCVRLWSQEAGDDVLILFVDYGYADILNLKFSLIK